MSVTPQQYLWLHGLLAANASLPTYTRLHLPVGPLARFVEFDTAAAVSGASLPPGQLTNTAVDYYVPTTSPLFFSDDPAPTPPAPLLGGALRQTPGPVPVGLVLADGSPVTVATPPGGGAAIGMNGVTKDGDPLSIMLSTANANSPGRVPGTTASWAFCHAIVSQDNQPIVTMGVGFSPTNLLINFFLTHQNVTSSIVVDLSGVVGAGGSATLNRKVTYYGQAFSQQILNTPVNIPGVGMYLATSPCWRVADLVDLFAPALTAVVGPLEKQPAPPLPLIALGSLDVGQGEAQAAYVTRGADLAGAALANLASELCVSYIPGIADLAQWLGWTLAGAGRPALVSTFTAAYTTYETWLKSQGVGASHGGWRTILSGSKDSFADQAVDWLHDHSH